MGMDKEDCLDMVLVPTLFFGMKSSRGVLRKIDQKCQYTFNVMASIKIKAHELGVRFNGANPKRVLQ